jgi:hypothetical protein
MRSGTEDHDNLICIERRTVTYCRWNKRIHLQDVLHRLTIDCIVLLVYDFTGRSGAIAPAQVVNASQRLTLRYVSMLPTLSTI